MNEVAIGVVGAGGMGKNHVRVLSSLPGAKLVGVFDIDRDTAAAVAAANGAVPVYDELDALAAACEALVLAVPTRDHAKDGCALFARGKHLLVEKPLAASLKEADDLIAAAQAAGKVLAVGHVEFFNPAVAAMVAIGARPRFVETQRLGVFSPRSLDVDVVLDLMIHDLQVLHALDPSPVAEIRATGIKVLSPKIDIANIRLELESGCVANLTASRVSSDRTRKIRAFVQNGYYSLDYIAQEVKGYRLETAGESLAIVPADLDVQKEEPLRRELAAFVAACRGEEARIVSGEEGRRALATALEIVRAIRVR